MKAAVALAAVALALAACNMSPTTPITGGAPGTTQPGVAAEPSATPTNGTTPLNSPALNTAPIPPAPQ